MGATMSVGAKLRQMAGLVDTTTITDWENRFLKNVLRSTGDGARTSVLTSDQVEKVDEIFERYCK